MLFNFAKWGVLGCCSLLICSGDFEPALQPGGVSVHATARAQVWGVSARSIMTHWGDGVAESSPGKEGKSAAVFWGFFGMCWEVRGRSKRQGMHSKDHTAQSYLKLCFGYYNGHIVSGFASVTTATNWQNTMLIVKTFFLKFVLIWPRKTWLFLPEAQFLSYAKYMCLPSCWDYSSFLI